MEVITKSIPKDVSSSHFRIPVPLIYFKSFGIETGDMIKITPSLTGYYLIERSSDKTGMTVSIHNDFLFPAHLMHKYRITNKHTVQFIVSKGRLIFSFNKPKNE